MTERFLVQLLDGGTISEHVRVYATSGVGVVETNTIVTIAIAAHAADTTDVHGIADTATLETQAGAQAKVDLHNAQTTDVHGIADTTVLATDAELAAGIAAHDADTSVHGIPDTTALETKAGAAAKVEAHRLDTTDVHGIADTTALETQAGAQAKVDALETALAADIASGDAATAAAAAAALEAHRLDTTAVHGIADTSVLETQAGAQAKANAAEAAANAYTDTVTDTIADNTAANLAAHATDTTNIHGIPDTSLLETQVGAQAKATAALDAANTYTDTRVDTLADNTAANLAAHATDTTNIHGIPDTAELATTTELNTAITGAVDAAYAYTDTHAADTTAVHGIADTAVLETQAGAQAKVDELDATLPSRFAPLIEIFAPPPTGIDDTEALQTALGAAQAAGGGIVRISGGNYATNAPLTVYWRTTLEGVGRGISLITFTGSAGEAAIQAADGAVVTHCTFRGFSVRPETAGTYCFNWSNFSYSKFCDLAADLREAGCVGFRARGNGLGSGPYYNVFDAIQVAGRANGATYPDQVAFQLLPALSGGFGSDGPNRNAFTNLHRISGVGTAFDIQSGNGNTGSSINAESIQDYAFRFNNRPADFTGTATSGTANTLTDSGAAFAGLSAGCLVVTAGTGVGTVAFIDSATATVITLEQAHPVAFDNTTVYAAYKAKGQKNSFRDVTIEGASGAVPFQNNYGGHSNVVMACKAESLGSGVWANEGQNQDSMFSQDKGQLVPLTFWANNLAANTVTELFPLGGQESAVAGGIMLPMTAFVHSVSTAMDEFDDATGAGQVTIAVLRAGTALTALGHSLNIHNPYGFCKIAQTPGTAGSNNLRNKRIRVQATTDATWDQTGANVTVTVWMIL